MGRIVEITNHFFVEDLNVNGYTTKDNIYLQLNGSNADLADFKKNAIKYIGLSLNPKKLNPYILVYREVSEKYGIELKGLENEKVFEKSAPPVELSGDDDSPAPEPTIKVVKGETKLPEPTIQLVEKEVEVIQLEPEAPTIPVEVIKKPQRTRRSAARTKGLTVGSVPKK
tara:strand:+ start:1709 stop:2218 length:510 start_codon:yes stop_codon:yes gene_type:complete